MKKVVTIFLALFIAFSTIIGTGMYFYLKPDVVNAVTEENKEVDFENLDVSNYKERVNVLLLGVDILETEKDQPGTRTDTIMVLSVDPTTKTGFILSVPRDSYVQISGTQEYTKINHAHSRGGTDLAIATIKDFLGIPIHHYMKVDYQALFKTVDDLGGVEFDVPIDMKYYDSASVPPLDIDLKAGLQTLNGEQAMGLLRFRKGYPDQDLGRIRTQQSFLEAVMKKASSPTSITKIPKYIETVYQYVETDMSIKDIMSLVKIGISLDLSRVEKATIPGEPTMINGASVIQVNHEEMKTLLDYLTSGNYPTPETETPESSEEATEEKAADSSNLKDKVENVSSDNTINDKNIVVLNGSGVSGVARRASDLLKIQDILVDSSGNASSFDNNSTIIYYKDDAALATKIKDILKVKTTQKGTKSIVSSEPDIVILIGKDFN